MANCHASGSGAAACDGPAAIASRTAIAQQCLACVFPIALLPFVSVDVVHCRNMPAGVGMAERSVVRRT